MCCMVLDQVYLWGDSSWCSLTFLAVAHVLYGLRSGPHLGLTLHDHHLLLTVAHVLYGLAWDPLVGRIFKGLQHFLICHNMLFLLPFVLLIGEISTHYRSGQVVKECLKTRVSRAERSTCPHMHWLRFRARHDPFLNLTVAHVLYGFGSGSLLGKIFMILTHIWQ